MVMEVKARQPEKQLYPNEVTEEGMVMEVKALQSQKHSYPNEVTEEGMVMEVKALHLRKHSLPNEVTEEGMVMEVKSMQPSKQLFPNEITLYATPSLPLTFSGILISPEYPPYFLGKSVAVFVSESKLYRIPSMTSAITELAVMSIMTTKTIKLLKELWADRLAPICPFLNVKNPINLFF